MTPITTLIIIITVIKLIASMTIHITYPGPGASDNPCDETFHGPSAASEPETQTVVDYVMGNTNPAWLVDVSMHTYGQYLLTPYGDCSLPPNWDTGLVNVQIVHYFSFSNL